MEPIAQAFSPSIVIVSCGFDAAAGDPLGGYSISPAAYAHLIRRLQCIPSANGRVVVALEGGCNHSKYYCMHTSWIPFNV